ncbi:MAG TPA: hypothetical protein VFG10_19045 [Saprospiraceae bacterium]|nr:hypothetical protein [Saprospiraceae bacterium]
MTDTNIPNLLDRNFLYQYYQSLGDSIRTSKQELIRTILTKLLKHEPTEEQMERCTFRHYSSDPSKEILTYWIIDNGVSMDIDIGFIWMNFEDNTIQFDPMPPFK